jgi:hypothetical protein
MHGFWFGKKRQANKQTNKQTNKQVVLALLCPQLAASKVPGMQLITNKQTSKQTSKQANKQTMTKQATTTTLHMPQAKNGKPSHN